MALNFGEDNLFLQSDVREQVVSQESNAVFGSIIKSIQYGYIDMAGSSTKTVTISEVNPTNSILIFLGNDGNVNLVKQIMTRIELTNGVTVTGFKNDSVNHGDARFCVIEFREGIIKLNQKGTIVSDGPTDTVNVATVDTTKAALFYEGATTDTGFDEGDMLAMLTLTDATTITAYRESYAGNLTVGFQLVEFY